MIMKQSPVPLCHWQRRLFYFSRISILKLLNDANVDPRNLRLFINSHLDSTEFLAFLIQWLGSLKRKIGLFVTGCDIAMSNVSSDLDKPGTLAIGNCKLFMEILPLNFMKVLES